MRSKPDLLLHPVRLRLLQALAGGRRLTSGQLAATMPDVPQATLYRHIAVLTDAGVLAVVEERPARGTPERVLALVEGAAAVTPQSLAAATPEDHMRWFTTFVAGLLGDFGRYLQRDGVDLVADGVGYRQVPLELTDQEFAELVGRLGAALAPALAHEPTPERTRRMFTTVVMPTPSTPEEVVP